MKPSSIKNITAFVPVALVLILLLLSFSCNHDGLDIDLSGNTTDVIDNPQAVQKDVFGIYEKFNELYNPASFSAGVDVVSLHAIYYLMGDDITTQNINVFEHFGGINADNSAVTQLYKQIYIMNARANSVIDIINTKGASIYGTDDVTKNTHLGEAHFLRGYTHFLLWNYFGTAPLINQSFTNISDAFGVKNSSGTELLDAAIDDFRQASTLLPETYPAQFMGRVTKNGALGFLGKALLFKASATKDASAYTDALTALKSVNGTLIPNDMDNFSASDENNAESLFEFQATTSSDNNIWISNDVYGSGAACTTWNFYLLQEADGWIFNGEQGKFRPTQKLIDLFDPNDPRKAAFIDGTASATANFKKYVTDNNLIPGKEGSSTNNPRLLRYADVVLLKAEAVLKSGGSTTEAIGYINEVRQRARNGGTYPLDRSTAETNKATIMQWIMDERLMELCGEDNIRWFDLRRWDMSGDITLNNSYFNTLDNTAIAFQMPKNLYLPIPNTEIVINANLHQNEGY